ncbi:MAG: hypothetical protein ACYS3N_11125 [Planctomycetota bacterium]|jgi:hypothetical protein
MYRLTIVFYCCFLIGCGSKTDQNTADFKERQKQLFYEIDRKLVYQSCQELMRLHREGKLSVSTFYLDDTPARRNELPKPIRSLQSTRVNVSEIMMDISFHHGKDGTQLLRCFSNEFGEPKQNNESSKGLGFRTNPFEMDKLSGNESLEYLNENYDHFQIELIPGLTYEMFPDESPASIEQVKQEGESMDMLMNFMTKAIEELAVKKQRLLHKTDHRELLKVCRQMINDYNNGIFSRSKINVGQYQLSKDLNIPEIITDEDEFSKDLKHIPEIILNLEPVYIWFDKNRVMVALIGGMDHAGVTAYTNNEEAIVGDDNMKLIDGLLYYDDGLREADDDYKDYIKSLKNEAISYLDWKRKQMNLPIPKRKK